MWVILERCLAEQVIVALLRSSVLLYDSTTTLTASASSTKGARSVNEKHVGHVDGETPQHLL